MKDIEFIYKDALVSRDEVKETAGVLTSYIGHLSDISKVGKTAPYKIDYNEAGSSINLPFDSSILEMVNDAVKKVDVKNLKYIIVVGIGGSNLGTKAVYDSLRGALDPFFANKTPKIIFADTNSPKLLKDIRTVLEKNIEVSEEVLINIISKSGTTVETIANFEAIYAFLEERFEDIKKRVVVTTDHGSKLWEKAEKDGLEMLPIPQIVGGRYSVFSAVGLFPLALVGIDVTALLNGARVMHDKCVKEDVSENYALMSAVVLYLHNKKGITIHNSFFFNPELESLGKWYRQLMAESIGKRYTTDGKEVHTGITPIVSIGSTDLHSMVQLYLGGLKDKFTTFIYASGNSGKEAVPKNLVFPDLVEGIEGMEFAKIMDTIFSGVKESYKKGGLPFIEILFPQIDEYSLGQFLQFKMIEIMFLARLFEINAFDQPNVEDYKKEVRKILLSEK